MKKYVLFIMLASFMATSFAQQSKVVRKDEKKQEKIDKKSSEMENATRRANGRRSLKKMDKMEKKEDKLDKKSVK